MFRNLVTTMAVTFVHPVVEFQLHLGCGRFRQHAPFLRRWWRLVVTFNLLLDDNWKDVVLGPEWLKRDGAAHRRESG